jgi:hypothetical protein
MLLSVATFGCAAQSENFDDRDWTKDHGLQQGPAWREVESLFGASESDVDRFEHSLPGVRHDLVLKEGGKVDTRCTCLDVAIGDPSDGRFGWAGRRPTVSGSDMVLAVRTQGSNCPKASSNRRPSIQAVTVQGGNVTIVIEELKFDRPQALGAVVRKPSPAGGLFVKSAKKSMPYAQTVGGKNLCKVETELHSHHQKIHSGRRF